MFESLAPIILCSLCLCFLTTLFSSSYAQGSFECPVSVNNLPLVEVTLHTSLNSSIHSVLTSFFQMFGRFCILPRRTNTKGELINLVGFFPFHAKQLLGLILITFHFHLTILVDSFAPWKQLLQSVRSYAGYIIMTSPYFLIRGVTGPLWDYQWSLQIPRWNCSEEMATVAVCKEIISFSIAKKKDPNRSWVRCGCRLPSQIVCNVGWSPLSGSRKD